MRRAAALTILALVTIAGPATGTETEWWINDTAKDFLSGSGNGVAVTERGRLRWAPGWTTAAELDEAVLSCAVAHHGRLLVGTGFPAALYAVGDGGPRKLAEVPAEQVTAMVRGVDDTVYVATVAPAAVLSWDGDELQTLGDVEVDGVWDLAWFDGGLVAAGGAPATLYRLGDRGLTRWAELPDTHARSLAVDGERLLVGTSGKGRMFAVDTGGRRSLLADSKFTEIVDIETGADGALWAAAVVGEPEARKKKRSTGKQEDEDNGQPSVAVASSSDLDLPKVNGKTATSELLRITPEGALLRRHRFTEQVVTALMRDGDGVLVGTGFEGEVWRFSDQGGSRMAVVDAVQVTTFADTRRFALTQGPAHVLERRTGGTGRFRPQPLHCERPVRWGAYRLTGATDDIRIRFRSGATDKPDDTWSTWSEWRSGPRGEASAPSGRSLQWEVEMPSGGHLERVEVAYREHNLAPRVTELEVLEPAEVYLTGAPPSGQTVDVSHPDVNGLFTVLGDEQGNTDATSRRQGKKYWRVGYRSVSWTAEDPNDDPLRFRLDMEDRGGRSFLVRERLKSTILAVDVTAVPDGWYRFRLTATDEAGNPGAGLESRTLSRWFLVDGTPPRLSVEREDDHWVVTATDRGSGVARAEVTGDDRGWRGMTPADGLFDDTVERFVVEVPEDEAYLIVRVFDRHHNRVTTGIGEE